MIERNLSSVPAAVRKDFHSVMPTRRDRKDASVGWRLQKLKLLERIYDMVHYSSCNFLIDCFFVYYLQHKSIQFDEVLSLSSFADYLKDLELHSTSTLKLVDSDLRLSHRWRFDLLYWPGCNRGLRHTCYFGGGRNLIGCALASGDSCTAVMVPTTSYYGCTWSLETGS